MTKYVVLVRWAGNPNFEKYFMGSEDSCKKKIKELETDLKIGGDEETEIRTIGIARYKSGEHNSWKRWNDNYEEQLRRLTQ